MIKEKNISTFDEFKLGILQYIESKMGNEAVSVQQHFQTLLNEINLRYEQRFTGQEAATKAALLSAQLAIDKAEGNSERWRANANEWRATLGDRDKSYTSTESHVMLSKKVDELESLRDIAYGKASQTSVLWAIFIACAGLLMGAIHVALMMAK